MSRNLSIILVPGAWHTQEHVKHFAPYFEEKGYRFVVVELRTSVQLDPLPTLQDNIPPIVSAMKAEAAAGNKICLVGHSVSGQSCVLAANEFLSTAAEDDDKAKLVHMVFISCFLNAIRATAGVTWYTIDYETMWASLHSPDEIHQHFYNDMPRADAQPFIDELKYNRAQLPPDNIPETWKQVDGTYFVLTKDVAIKPEMQRLEAQESGMKAVELDMDHCPFVSRPKDFQQELTKVLEGL